MCVQVCESMWVSECGGGCRRRMSSDHTSQVGRGVCREPAGPWGRRAGVGWCRVVLLWEGFGDTLRGTWTRWGPARRGGQDRKGNETLEETGERGVGSSLRKRQPGAGGVSRGSGWSTCLRASWGGCHRRGGVKEGSGTRAGRYQGAEHRACSLGSSSREVTGL